MATGDVRFQRAIIFKHNVSYRLLLYYQFRFYIIFKREEDRSRYRLPETVTGLDELT